MDTDSINESYSSDLQAILKNRVALVPINSATLNSNYLNEVLTQNNLLLVSSFDGCDSNESLPINRDSLTFLKCYLHDKGVINVVTSSSFSANCKYQVIG
jgi:hypothetical protein